MHNRGSFNIEVPATRRELNDIERSWLLRPEVLQTRNFFTLRRTLILGIVAAAILTGVIATLAKTVPNHHHHLATPDTYTLALQKALVFFNAQRSGRLPLDNGVSWRGDSCLHDGSPVRDLTGGYYDAGDAIKFTFPQAFAITLLSWSAIDYRGKYEAAGEFDHVRAVIRWGTDYFLKTFDHTADSIDRIVTQVGRAGLPEGTDPNDHSCWMRPEDIDYERPVTECSTCSDLAAEMAAALASASIVFKDDGAYSRKLIHGAAVLFQFSRDRRGLYSIGNEGSVHYNSTSFWDEMVWGATWLFCATGNISYLELATDPKLAEHSGASVWGPSYGVLSWDNKLPAAQVLLSRVRIFLNPGYPYEEVLGLSHKQTQTFMCSYLANFTSFKRTKGGMIELSHGAPQNLQNVVNAAFLAQVFKDYMDASLIPGWYCGPTFYSSGYLRQFAETQIDYILGKNPQNMSYVVGFGERYPKQVHHRGASIPNNNVTYSCKGGGTWRISKKPNPNTIIGAMVGGPDSRDGFKDLRLNYNYTEPTIAGNSGLVAALVALSGESSVGINEKALFAAVKPKVFYPADPPPPAPWQPGD